MSGMVVGKLALKWLYITVCWPGYQLANHTTHAWQKDWTVLESTTARWTAAIRPWWAEYGVSWGQNYLFQKVDVANQFGDHHLYKTNQ